MGKSFLVFSLVAAMAAPSLAHANCSGRKLGGTVIGGVSGGLIGSAVSHGALAGGLIGAGIGAFAGHEIAGSGCRSYGYYRYHHRYVRRAGYDRYQRTAAGYGPSSAGPARCEMHDQAFYDERGELIHRPAQVCR